MTKIAPTQSAVPTQGNDIVTVAKAAAAGTKTDFRSLLASSLSESRHNPHAKNPRSSAAGAFQFTERTWLDLVRRHGAALGHAKEAAKVTVSAKGAPTVADPAERKAILALRSDTRFAGALAARYSDENRTALTRSLGRKVSENEVRMAYLLGAGGAARVLKAAKERPGVTVDKLIPSAVHSNPSLFVNPGGGVKTAKEAVAALERRFDAASRHVARTKLSAADPAQIGIPTDDEGGGAAESVA
jgi:hypothetical protein